MREDFLHFLWKFKKFHTTNLKTDRGEPVQIIALGEHNLNAGPDFFNARLNIGHQLWAGNVEIHIKSSDWYLHQHEIDKTYDNVILHVVWEHDTPIFRKTNQPIPTLILKDYINPELISSYQHLFQEKKKWINCENDFQYVDDFLLQHWLERLYFNRLEQKTKAILQLLEESKNDWEAVLFKMLCKSFGSKINGDAFLTLANSIDYSIIRKTKSNLQALEALLLGQAGLLEKEPQTLYHEQLRKDFQFLKQKFTLNQDSVLPLQFFRLRPLNFPTIRLSQLAQLYHQEENLFSKLLECNTKACFYDLLKSTASEFWNTHYTFFAVSKYSKKSVSHAFIDLILINTIIPLIFCYQKKQGSHNSDNLVSLSKSIKAESNNIISGFKHLNVTSKSALETQALIELKTHYCDKNQCLQCAIGNSLLSR
ncbi:DUF2851 family protein [Gaetbulibacter aestuarii]|uniref:DUF2851 family protein n=1 Tax=Gaetbulibacter aestuarii TaxID=1502358 RepID=A0ABW7MZC8_9FLAO